MIVFDVARADPPRELPLLRLHADGHAIVRMRDGAASETDFGRDRLRELLTFAVRKQDFRRIDAREIEAAIRTRTAETGRMFEVADAPTSHVAIDLGTGRHAVTLFAAAMAATVFPSIAPLQRLRRIEMRLLATLSKLRTNAEER